MLKDRVQIPDELRNLGAPTGEVESAAALENRQTL
jgi:hypothetical protein